MPINAGTPESRKTPAERLEQFCRGNGLPVDPVPEIPKFPFVQANQTPEQRRKQVESMNPSRPSPDQHLKSLGLRKRD